MICFIFLLLLNNYVLGAATPNSTSSVSAIKSLDSCGDFEIKPIDCSFFENVANQSKFYNVLSLDGAGLNNIATTTVLNCTERYAFERTKYI